MVSEKEWLQPMAEKFLLQEEEKEEKYYPHNYGYYRAAERGLLSYIVKLL